MGAAGGETGKEADSVLVHPQVREKGGVWRGARSPRYRGQLSMPLLSNGHLQGACGGGPATLAGVRPAPRSLWSIAVCQALC